MEVKSEKVSDNGRKTLVDLKRKRASQYATYFTEAGRMVVSRKKTMNSVSSKLFRRVRSNVQKNKHGSHFRNFVLIHYSNFMKSGLPQCLMFYHDGQWAYFPENFVKLIRNDFQAKKVAIEVKFEGHFSLLDILYMIKIDMKTGLQEPIAWIDEAGNRFFPASYSDYELDDHYPSNVRNQRGAKHIESEENHGIKLQLEIEINGSFNSKLEESNEESNIHVKRLKVNEKFSSSDYKLEKKDNSVEKSNTKAKEVVAENLQLDVISSKNHIHESMDEKLTYDTVKYMFLTGIGSCIDKKNIIEIYQDSSNLAQARLERFQKQVEITQKYRGDAHVLYAWLASPKASVSRIMMHGLGLNEMPHSKPTYGVGVHLIPANCPRISAGSCDIDENGVQHMVLCRVIMGNMELVQCGSEQFHPSSQCFDSGVDDLQNPSCYIIWDFNMNSHIYPEYVVSFRAPPSAKGYLVGNENKFYTSGVTNSARCQGQLRPDSSAGGSVGNSHLLPDSAKKLEEKVPTFGPCTPKIPKSPWMPFPLLFKVISSKVPPKDMEMVNFYYDQFMRKLISRDNFVIKLRRIVGDTLLKATITGLLCKLPSNPESELKLRNNEQMEEATDSS